MNSDSTYFDVSNFEFVDPNDKIPRLPRRIKDISCDYIVIIREVPRSIH